jgi:hypothetical protein
MSTHLIMPEAISILLTQTDVYAIFYLNNIIFLETTSLSIFKIYRYVSASIIVKSDIDVVPPVVTVPSEFTVLVFLSGLAGLTAESPNEDNHSIYFEKYFLLSSGLEG